MVAIERQQLIDKIVKLLDGVVQEQKIMYKRIEWPTMIPVATQSQLVETACTAEHLGQVKGLLARHLETLLLQVDGQLGVLRDGGLQHTFLVRIVQLNVVVDGVPLEQRCMRIVVLQPFDMDLQIFQPQLEEQTCRILVACLAILLETVQKCSQLFAQKSDGVIPLIDQSHGAVLLNLFKFTCFFRFFLCCCFM